jgi:hypothetical protein
MVLFFVFSIRFFFQVGRHREAAPAIAGGAFFFLYLLLKPDLCLFAGASMTRSPSMVFAGLLRFCHLKPLPRRNSMPGAWPARARDLLLGQQRVWATLRLPNRDRWCSVVSGRRLLQWSS